MKKSNVAIALKYKSEIDNAPKIVAKGRGVVATNIINKGHKEDVYVHRNEDLANKLDSIELGSNIPVELYEVVAGILAFVYEIDKKRGLDEAGE